MAYWANIVGELGIGLIGLIMTANLDLEELRCFTNIFNGSKYIFVFLIKNLSVNLLNSEIVA